MMKTKMMMNIRRTHLSRCQLVALRSRYVLLKPIQSFSNIPGVIIYSQPQAEGLSDSPLCSPTIVQNFYLRCSPPLALGHFHFLIFSFSLLILVISTYSPFWKPQCIIGCQLPALMRMGFMIHSRHGALLTFPYLHYS